MPLPLRDTEYHPARGARRIVNGVVYRVSRRSVESGSYPRAVHRRSRRHVRPFHLGLLVIACLPFYVSLGREVTAFVYTGPLLLRKCHVQNQRNADNAPIQPLAHDRQTRVEVDEISADPLPSGHTSRRWGVGLKRVDGTVALEPDLWPQVNTEKNR